jgi:hypothetical protein
VGRDHDLFGWGVTVEFSRNQVRSYEYASWMARAGEITHSIRLLLGKAEARVANRDNVSLDRCVRRIRGHAGCHETLI